VQDIKILGNNIEEKTVLFSTVEKDYTFKFENLAEFRDFLIYFIFVRKTANGQKLFDPPECVRSSHQFLSLIRQSQQLSEHNRKLLKAGFPAQHLRDDVRPLDHSANQQAGLVVSQAAPEEAERDLQRKKKQDLIKNCDTDDEIEALERKKKKKKQPQTLPPEADPAQEAASPPPPKPQERPQRHIVRKELPADEPVQKVALKKPTVSLQARQSKPPVAEKDAEADEPVEGPQKTREAQKPQATGLASSLPGTGVARPMRLAPSNQQTLRSTLDPQTAKKPLADKEETLPRPSNSNFVDDTVDIDFTTSLAVSKVADPLLVAEPTHQPLTSSLVTGGPKPKLITPKVNFTPKPPNKNTLFIDKLPPQERKAAVPEPSFKLPDQKPRLKQLQRDEEGDWEVDTHQQAEPRAPAKVSHNNNNKNNEDFDFDD